MLKQNHSEIIFPKQKKEKKKALKIEKHIKREWKEELTDRESDGFSKFAGFFSVLAKCSWLS